MEYTINDHRLPAGVSIFANSWKEFVAVENGQVAQINGKNARAGATVDEAVKHYLGATA